MCFNALLVFNNQDDKGAQVARAVLFREWRTFGSCECEFERVRSLRSWWAESFCAGNDSGAVNIVMTELRDTLALCATLLQCNGMKDLSCSMSKRSLRFE